MVVHLHLPEPEDTNASPPMAYFKIKEYSIGENEGSDSLAVYVCVGLSGTLEEPVSVQLQTESGTATGTRQCSRSIIIKHILFILS